MSVHLYQAGHMPRAKDVISFVKFPFFMHTDLIVLAAVIRQDS